jgi:hypothetical protein
MFDGGKRDMGDVTITFLWEVYSEYLFAVERAQ